MPFLTDTTWPRYMRIRLSASRGSENYHGFYNGLLFHCFDAYRNDTMVAPEKHRFDSLYLIIKDYQWNSLLITHVGSDVSPSGRANSDKQMRRKYEAYLAKCPFRRLWGLSFVGSSLRVYCGDVASGTVVPPAEDQLEGAWNIETLSPVGFAVIKEIVKDVTDMGCYEEYSDDTSRDE